VAATSSAASASDASTAKTSVRVSTGVSQPKLLGTPHITITESERNLANNTVVVGLLVDAAGKPQDVQIVKSLGKNLDENVLSAVRQFRFQPAQLDAQAIPVHVNLSIILEP
jgi:protein TonB